MKIESGNIERELRFVLSDLQYQKFKTLVQNNSNLFVPGVSVLETTIMYDNPNPSFTFYSNEIDGRLRLRISSIAKQDLFNIMSDLSNCKSKLTWKQRIPEFAKSDLRVEKEVEIHIDNDETNLLMVILSEVLKCPRISSYERYRETFYTIDNGIEIASDLFPYGHVIELELKDGSESKLHDLVCLLGLDSTFPSKLSCDDMYYLLCKIANVLPQNDISFADNTMPKLDHYLILIKDEII